jgi:hypothetical protein
MVLLDLFTFRRSPRREVLLGVEEILAVGDVWMLVRPPPGIPPAPDSVA